MHLIIYTSRSTVAASVIDEELIKISKQAKKNNQALKISGVLFYHNGVFVQVLEGEKRDLEQLMTRLEFDNRHQYIERLIDQDISEASFSDWNMDSFNLDATAHIDQAALAMFIEVYKLNFDIETDKLIKTFKAMIESH